MISPRSSRRRTPMCPTAGCSCRSSRATSGSPLFYGLMESTEAAEPLSAPMTLNSWLSASNGDASGFWFTSLLADMAFPKSFVWGDIAAASRADARAAARYYATGGNRANSIIGSPGTDFLWAGGRLTTAWPAGPDDNAYSDVRTSRVPTLMIGGDLDFATPPQNATRELLAAPPERPSDRASEPRAHARFLELRAEGELRTSSTPSSPAARSTTRSTRVRPWTSPPGSRIPCSPRASRARWSASRSSRCCRCG